MKKFLIEFKSEFQSTFSLMMIIFIMANFIKKNEMISLNLLIQMMMLAIIVSLLIMLCFKDYLLKKISEPLRIILFVVVFGVLSYIMIVGLGWFSISNNPLDSWHTFYKIFLFTFVLVALVIFILIFEINYQKKGKEYTKKLKEFKEGKNEK